MRRRGAPTGITMIIMVFIISIMGVARWSLITGTETEVQAVADMAVLKPDADLNEAEAQVLYQLSQLIGDTGREVSNGMITENIYYDCLSEHYRAYGMNLSTAVADKINRLIRDGKKLLLLEEGRQLGEMSLDGREVAIHIFKEIYRSSGLKLGIQPDGTIEQIVSQSGKQYYINNKSLQEEFRIETLIFILMVLITLLGTCIIIAKRKQLFVKSGEYIHEKGIA